MEVLNIVKVTVLLSLIKTGTVECYDCLYHCRNEGPKTIEYTRSTCSDGCPLGFNCTLTSYHMSSYHARFCIDKPVCTAGYCGCVTLQCQRNLPAVIPRSLEIPSNYKSLTITSSESTVPSIPSPSDDHDKFTVEDLGMMFAIVFVSFADAVLIQWMIMNSLRTLCPCGRKEYWYTRLKRQRRINCSLRCHSLIYKPWYYMHMKSCHSAQCSINKPYEDHIFGDCYIGVYNVALSARNSNNQAAIE